MFAKRNLYILLVILSIGGFAYFLSTLFGTFTIHGYVDANVQKITAGVNGFIKKVYVKDNQYVTKGQLLLQIDPRPYQYAIEKLKASLAQNNAQYPLLQNAIKIAAYAYDSDNRNMQLAKLNMSRNKQLLTTSAVSVARYQQFEVDYKKLYDQVQKDKYTYNTNVQKLKLLQSTIEQIKAQLKIAEYNLSQTKITASQSGYITNMYFYKGDYVASGQQLFGIVGDQSWRIVAEYHQNLVRKIHVGQKVLVNLSSDPWHIYHGVVVSVGRGVARNQSNSNSLPYIEPIMSWLTYDYYFPVRIKLTKQDQKKAQLYLGSDAKTFVVY